MEITERHLTPFSEINYLPSESWCARKIKDLPRDVITDLNHETWNIHCLKEADKVIFFIIDQPKRFLGSGGTSKVYQGKVLELNVKGHASIMPVAIAKIKSGFFHTSAFTLLNTIPPCPALLSRPFYRFKTSHHEKNKTYLVEELLNFPDLHTHLNTIPEPKTLEVFIHGMKNIALGLSTLHTYKCVHRDPTLKNGSYEGLFDYGSLCKEGEPSSHNGAPIIFQPPEVLIQSITSLEKQLRINRTLSPLQAKRLERYLQRKEALDLPKEYVNYWRQIQEESPSFLQPYFPSCDTYILGSQWITYFGPLETWREEMGPVFELLPLIQTMTHHDPKARPSMTTIHSELELFYQNNFS
jgi:serine/threonine protein kinase